MYFSPPSLVSRLREKPEHVIHEHLGTLTPRASEGRRAGAKFHQIRNQTRLRWNSKRLFKKREKRSTRSSSGIFYFILFFFTFWYSYYYFERGFDFLRSYISSLLFFFLDDSKRRFRWQERELFGFACFHGVEVACGKGGRRERRNRLSRKGGTGRRRIIWKERRWSEIRRNRRIEIKRTWGGGVKEGEEKHKEENLKGGRR